MHPPYDAAEAARTLAEFAPACGEALALRIHTARLLGRDPSLVLHGGGNTSVKAMATEVTGEPVEVLWVKGSGVDLATIGPPGFVACRLAPLQAICRLERLEDARMVAGLRSQMLDPAGPTPSVEALLHAWIPARFVDHSHADAVLATQDQPDARQLATEIWGPSFAFIPYVMPGFALARRVVELVPDFAGLDGLILEQHGIFTWGDTAQQSYERMIAAVSRAEQWRRERRPAVAAMPGIGLHADGLARRARLGPVVRGVLASHAAGRRFLATWRDDPAIMALADHPDGEAIATRGTVTPDHVIRTRPRPLWLPASVADLAPDELRTTVAGAVDRHREWYAGYFSRGTARSSTPLLGLDPFPRIVMVPGTGALLLGRTLDEARIVGDILAHAAQVMLDAEAIGRFHPVSEADLFDVEYWSLEQAKLGGGGAPGPLAGQVALVTGAGRPGGIGWATAEHLLRLGAHLLATDRTEDSLEAFAAALGPGWGNRLATRPCDVASPESVQRAVAAAVGQFGGLDLVVSNAGTAPVGPMLARETDAALRASLEVNLLGHQRVAAAAAEVMVTQGSGGCLLFNGSKSAMAPGPDFGPYAIAKAGLLALMRQYAIELGPHGIRANAVNADRVRTSLFDGGVLEARAGARGVSTEEYFRQNLLGRETTAQDVAAAFGWLATAGGTTGCVVTVDGGQPGAFPR